MPLFSRVVEPTPIDPSRYRKSDSSIQREKEFAEIFKALGADDDPPMKTWSDMQIAHLDGIEWHEAKIPPKRHVCWPQTQGWRMFDLTERCACGAISMSQPRYWMEVNQRRKEQR